MNEELQKALGELLNKANGGINAASDFLVAELPEVIQQLLMWHMVSNIVYCVISILLIYIPIKYHSKIKDKPKDGSSNNLYEWSEYNSIHRFRDDIETALFIYIGGVGSIMAIVTSIALFNIEWLQIYIAPKVWLLEYAANLTK